MKTFNFYLMISSLLLFIASSCDQKNIGAEYTPTNGSVSFLGSTSSLTADPDQTSIDYTIVRGNTSGKLELPITATYDQDIFSFPTSVVFDDGSASATLSIPLEKTELGTTYSIKLAFDSIMSSPGGNFQTTIKVMRDFVWVPAGTGMWTDGIITVIFGVDPLTYPVTLQEAQGYDGLYRMVNPYGLNVYDYTEAGDVVRNPSYVNIDARDPSKVVIDEQGIGIDYGYGEIFFASYTKNGYGTLNGKTITFPAGTLATGMRDYNSGNLTWLTDECDLELP